MHIYLKIYEFAASAGAFEGYVYRKPKGDIDSQALSNWANNLLDAYDQLPDEVVGELQSCCNQTLGRAIQSLIAEFGEEYVLIGKLQKMVNGKLPDNPDDFQKVKWFQK